MLRRHVTWQAILLTAVLMGGGAAVVLGQMTGARLPLQGVGIWGYDPNVGSFFSVRVDQDGTLIISFLPSGGIASVVPGVGPSGFFLVSILPGFGSLDRFLTSQIGLASVGGQVDIRGTGPQGSVLTSQVGLGSFSEGFPTKPVSTPTAGPSGSLLVSDVSTAWRGTYFSSMYTGTLGPNNGLGSVQLIRGIANTQIAVYHLLTTQSALGSIGLYNDADSPFSTFTGLRLWSNDFAAQGGAQMNPFGGPKKPTEYFRAQLGSSIWLMTVGSFSVHVNMLVSYEAP